MTFEGKVMIELGGGADDAVRVDYRQPVKIARILTGKSPATVPGLMATIHSVCGHAQAHASTLALEVASGIEADPATARARAVLTALETWRETLLRVVLDWPELTVEAADAGAARRAMALLPAMKIALFGESDPYLLGATAKPDMRAALALIGEAKAIAGASVLGEASGRFLARRGHDGLTDWVASCDTQAAGFMRHLIERDWMDEARVEIPALDLPARAEALERWLDIPTAETGAVPETTPYSRRRYEPSLSSLGSRGVGARYAARLTELARLPLEMRDLLLGEAQPSATSDLVGAEGVAMVEAARGLLAHFVRLEDGTVADYRIVAPTDWNFHRHGIAAQCLATLGARAERDTLAHLVIRAIDPCVAYELRGR